MYAYMLLLSEMFALSIPCFLEITPHLKFLKMLEHNYSDNLQTPPLKSRLMVKGQP